ncbi:glutamate racemase [Cupriavidus basilensis]|uniref:Glutamate racemase n=1 Tax=Cupriavidus basilensis TaxID=68895 RepID=A0ABT6AZ21_9BURK|nr:glutamate racemase [Cupriavidus basilensis]MDF3837744.1 glutamate racemase [Cupriavidus basilensis]
MIGVFDSGSGGLTVFKALRETFPDQHFVYYGDHGNAPYGNRDADTIYALTVSSLERLFELGCSLIVVACNTAAATGLRRLQQTWLPDRYPDKRVIGVIVPMIEAMTGVPWSVGSDNSLQAHTKETVAVFATRYTVESRVFVEETAKRAPNVNLVQQACPSLVRLIEANASVEDLRRAVRRYVTLLKRRLGEKRLDAVLLGCTHYPLVEDLFAEVMPRDVEIYSQPKVTASSLADYLARHPEFACGRESSVTFYTSTEPEQITKLAKRFLSDSSVQFQALP